MEKTSKVQLGDRQSTVFLRLFLRNIHGLLPVRVSTVDRRQQSVRVSRGPLPNRVSPVDRGPLPIHGLLPVRVSTVDRQQKSVRASRGPLPIRVSLRRLLHQYRLWTVVCGLLLLSTASGQRPPTQPLDLPLVSDLETSLQAFYEAERDAQLHAFDSGNKSNWVDLIPSIGVTYTLSNDPRPTVSWSPISILNRKDAKRKETLTREALLRSYELVISDRLYKLRQLVHDYFIDLDELKIKEQTLHLDERLFEIEEERYAQNLIKPSEHLREQKRILLARSIVSSYKQELHKKRSEVIYTAKWVDQNLY